MIFRIEEMLRRQRGRHISFHTPGHKRRGMDITELSYSDDLSSPTGVLKEAEKEIAALLGADRSFILTDGSTCGVFSMIYAFKTSGGARLAAPEFSHPSVFHACRALGVELVPIYSGTKYGLPSQPGAEAIEAAVREADGLLLTSPDYYGFFPPLEAAREICERAKKPFLLDGAHGGHLRFTKAHAGRYADMWVDGVHKSLPALTQGAVVSGKGDWAERLGASVGYFRTTSPSYPIMASVERAVKYPRNEALERAAAIFKEEHGCVLNDDWTKILVPFGSEADAAQRELESRGVYPEFNDGNYLMFYLSPCTTARELKILGGVLKKLRRGEVPEDAPCGRIPMYGGKR